MKIVIVLWLAICAWCDMRTGEVPNQLTLSAIVIGTVVAALNGMGAFALFAIILVVVLFLYQKIGIGGADSKILAALAGLWPESLLAVLVGLLVWSLVRRLAGRRGSYRAVLPMSLATLLIFVVDTAGFFP